MCIGGGTDVTKVDLIDLPAKEQESLRRAFDEVADGKLKPFRRRLI